MTGKIIDGLIVSAYVKSRVKMAIEKLTKEQETGIQPCLATVLVGNNPASISYINNKQKSAIDIGINTRDHRLDATISQNELVDLIMILNKDPKVHGILVQLPLPSHINEFSIINTINPLKDVDGLTPTNAGMLLKGQVALMPCTPSGIIELLKFFNIDVSSKDIVIVNRSDLVGKPLAILLTERDATVTICHSKSRNLIDKLKNADIIVTAVGNRERFVLSENMVKNDAVIVDVGISKYKGKTVGDVNDFQSMKEKVAWITPVPGGVGPMTIAMLLENTVTAFSAIADN